MNDFLASLDIRVLESLSAHRDLSTAQTLILITEMGSALFICVSMVCLALFLGLRKRYGYIAGLLVGVGGATGATLLLKYLLVRVRPATAYQAYIETGFSFPSAHAALAVAFYGFCIYLVWRMVRVRVWRIAITTCLGILIATIAFSRLYLGVHYLSDVAAGLVLGALFIWVGIVVARKLGKRN